MNILHVACTPVAGSPIRIVRALNKYTNCNARLVELSKNAYGRRVFDSDLSWQDHNEEAREIIRTADVIHFHHSHYIDLEFNCFDLNFRKETKKGVAFLRQFHTMPNTIGSWHGIDSKEILNDPIPKIVIAQFHERYYPFAKIVPNIVPINDDLYRPRRKSDENNQIFYAPSNRASAWTSRWDTKGYPETIKLLKAIKKNIAKVKVFIAEDLPHRECLSLRRTSCINIDEMITGSYHLSSLEGLAQGVPTFAFLDQRTKFILSEVTGTSSHPWMNFRLEESKAAIERLIVDAEFNCQVGKNSRDWMEKYWNDKAMIGYYVEAYDDLFNNPLKFRVPRFDEKNLKTRWYVQGGDDYIWNVRKKNQKKRFKLIR